MKMTHTRIVLVLAAVGAGAVIAACTVSQPEPECSVGRGNLYVLKMERTSGTCAEPRDYELVRMEVFNEPGTEVKTYAIRPVAIGRPPYPEQADTNTANSPNALGSGTLFPEANTCAVPTWQAARQDFVAATVELADGGMEDKPALSQSYLFSDVKFVNTASVPGTLVTGSLQYTENDCSDRYTFEGLWPAHECATDDDCLAEADPEAGRTLGSGINPDFPVRCETSVGLCVLTKPIAEIVP